MDNNEVFRRKDSMAKTEQEKQAIYICSFDGCTKSFSRKDRLIIHQRTHTGEKPFVCDVEGCDKQYARSAHLLRHIERTHSQSSKQSVLRCENKDCGAVFSTRCNLKRHIKRKHEAQRYLCPYEDCGKSFTKHQHLKVHQYEHTNINPFQCTYDGCTMNFRVPSLLRRHMKVHTGYTCDQEGCGAVFSKWTLYRNHKAHAHNNAQTFTCPQCNKQFSQKQWLKQHMKIHSDERELFACPRENCGRSYLDQRNLQAHIRSYHDGRRYQCQYPGCERKFSSEQKQRQHQKMHDPENKISTVKRRKKGIAEKLTGVNIREGDHLIADNSVKQDSIVPEEDQEMTDSDQSLCTKVQEMEHKSQVLEHQGLQVSQHMRSQISEHQGSQVSQHMRSQISEHQGSQVLQDMRSQVSKYQVSQVSDHHVQSLDNDNEAQQHQLLVLRNSDKGQISDDVHQKQIDAQCLQNIGQGRQEDCHQVQTFLEGVKQTFLDQRHRKLLSNHSCKVQKPDNCKDIKILKQGEKVQVLNECQNIVIDNYQKQLSNQLQ